MVRSERTIPPATKRSLPLKSALVSALTLVGGVLLGGGVGFIAFESLPGHMVEAARIGLSAISALVGMVAGGALWGWWLGRLAGVKEPQRMVWAGGIGYGGAVILAGILLSGLEVGIVERGLGSQIAVHRVFTLLFVPAAFCVAGIGAFSLGMALKDLPLAGRMGVRASLAAALAFLVVNLAMEGLGWVVGAPGAAERFTMITVLMVSNLGAALAGGAIVGVSLGNSMKGGILNLEF